MKAAFAHIAVPVDGSTTAERGVKYALELAHGGGAVTFCSVVDPSLACLPAAYGVGMDPGPMLTVLDDDAAEFCRRARVEAEAEGLTADVAVLHGQCIPAIESLVRQNGSGAIVVGTHGRTGLARTVLGSVAEGLMRHSDVPVIAVHEDDLTRTGPIAVALDESPAAHAALETAIGIASTRGTFLVLIHACDSAAPDHRDRANSLMTGAVKRVHARGVSVDVVVREGRAADVLLTSANDFGCSMIVMGTHGRPLVERLALGSVATYVVEHAKLPVVTVRRTTSG